MGRKHYRPSKQWGGNTIDLVNSVKGTTWTEYTVEREYCRPNPQWEGNTIDLVNSVKGTTWAGYNVGREYYRPSTQWKGNTIRASQLNIPHEKPEEW